MRPGGVPPAPPRETKPLDAKTIAGRLVKNAIDEANKINVYSLVRKLMHLESERSCDLACNLHDTGRSEALLRAGVAISAFLQRY